MEFEVKVGIVAVNLVIWTGLFLYILRLERKVQALTVDDRRDEP
ncbi:MAG: CcmD family protein [Acidobacteriota bacterium]